MAQNSRKQESEDVWWKTATIYQIWPHSFLDTNGNGHGDLRGIITKVPYLESLGVGAIWVSPMYTSPMVDMGYDISDYLNVNPIYGSMQDLEELIRECHSRGIRVLLDLVINHTSNKHNWFLQSKKSKAGEFADYYIWRDAKYDDNGNRLVPNNWGAFFGGSVWEWVEERQQYYLHLFTCEQPDINWESDKVREHIWKDAMKFWLKKGVDGFRADACQLYSKDQSFPDGDLDSSFFEGYGNWVPYVAPGPRLVEFWREIRDRLINEFPEAVIIGETGGDIEKTLGFVGGGPGVRCMNMYFDPKVLFCTRSVSNLLFPRPWKWSEIKKSVDELQQLVNLRDRRGWTSVWKENHDHPRSVTLFGSKDEKYRSRSAKLLAMWMATLSGTLSIYQGEEIGMTGVPADWKLEDFRDEWALRYIKNLARDKPDDNKARKEAFEAVSLTTRDNSRTPVQWSAEENAGFTRGTPWIRINPNYKEINVDHQLKDPDSLLNFWRAMLGIRKEYTNVFVHGIYTGLDPEREDQYTYMKKSIGGRSAFVVLNLSDEDADMYVPLPKDQQWSLLRSNLNGLSSKLQPWEGRVYISK